MAGPSPLPPQALARRCDPASLPFETTASLPDLDAPLGQERAVEALRLAMGLRQPGYNAFVAGPPQSGRHTIVKRLLEARAATEPAPEDLCYVHDFELAHRPRALRLPAGRGAALRRDVAALIEDVRATIPLALETDDHKARRRAIGEDLKAEHEKALEEIRKDAKGRGLALLHSPMGFAFAPVKDGEVIAPPAFHALPEEERRRIETEIEVLQERLRAVLDRLPQIERELRSRLKALLRETLEAALAPRFAEAVAAWSALPEVVAHLEAVRRDVLENAATFLPGAAAPESEEGSLPDGFQTTPESAAFRRYRVLLLVDHAASTGAPVVYEDHPTYANLVGRVEYVSQLGALVTDFNLIRPGALHRARGGYLVLDARELLMQPYAWEGLKRALRSRALRIESLGQMLSLVSTVSLEPEPIPLDVKLVLVGERRLYDLLDALDPDFPSLFKIAADWEDEVERSVALDLRFAGLVATLARSAGLLPLDRGAVAAVVDRACRWAGDVDRLSTRVGPVGDLLREADFAARGVGRTVVTAADVRAAVAAFERREGRVRERLLEELRKGTFLVDTDGARVGQVNGLAVLQAGRLPFGRPSRITAKVRLGRGEVVDVEREVELGGPIHSKGVLILSAFLGARYATDHPLSLSASLAFEQSYGPVDGDSASSAEGYALLSALADVPLSQSYAVTGALNQHGEVQAVGGVNEKIEGFFALCSVRGLTGRQGVLIPAANVRHLMLSDEVVEACREGRFRVIPVSTVDEGLEVLTGLPAGVRDATGSFPEGSVNARVEARLVALARRRFELGRLGMAEERKGGTP